MSSFDGAGAGGNAVAAEPRVASAPAAGDDGLDDQEAGSAADPWFAPGPKRPARPTAHDAGLAPPAGGDGPAEWFLPAGRAGLVPDSMTDSGADVSLPGVDRSGPAEAASSPPWEAEPTTPATGVPPPWETGPWPGPGDPQAASRRPHQPIASSDRPRSESEAANARRRPVPLLLAAGAGAVVLVVIIVVIVTGMSGSPTGGCGTYPAAVREAYARAMTDLRRHAPASVRSAALGQAASRANASAAAAGQIDVRTALFALASDLDQAHADATAGRALPATLLQHLAADGTALPASCSG